MPANKNVAHGSGCLSNERVDYPCSCGAEHAEEVASLREKLDKAMVVVNAAARVFKFGADELVYVRNALVENGFITLDGNRVEPQDMNKPEPVNA